MSTAITKLSEIQEKALEVIEQVQEPVVGAVKTAAEKASEVVPELPTFPFGEGFPTPTEILANQYEFVLKVLEQQKKFADALIDAVAPVSTKLVVVPEAKPARKASAKKAA